MYKYKTLQGLCCVCVCVCVCVLDGVSDPRWAAEVEQNNKKGMQRQERGEGRHSPFHLSFILLFKPRRESVLRSPLSLSLSLSDAFWCLSSRLNALSGCHAPTERSACTVSVCVCVCVCVWCGGLAWRLITLKSQTGRRKVYACVTLSENSKLWTDLFSGFYGSCELPTITQRLFFFLFYWHHATI